MRVYNYEGSTLRKDQLEMLEVLKAFAEICKEHDIKWWLCSGTLLGAARHKGFIPWDDDVDVSMLHEDFKKLQKVLINMDHPEYFYQCFKTDPDHIFPFGKFRKKNDPKEPIDVRASYYKYRGVGLDVFSIEKSNGLGAHLAKFFYLNMQNPTKYIKSPFWRHLAVRLVRWVNFGFLTQICRLIGRINRKGQYRYELGSGFYESPFYKEDIFPLSTMEFEGVEFPVPGNTEAYLTKMYGDWRQLPSEEQIKKALHYSQYKKEIFGDE